MEFTFIAYDLDEDGNWVNERDDTPQRDELGRIAAQTFRQVMSQRIREVERDRKFEEYANREGDIVTGIIQQTDTRYTLLDLGRVEALLPQAEQVPFERPQPGDRCKAYIVEVRRTAKGPQIVVSRTHPGLIKRLFELEVPEIADGIVEIKACAREPGHRTKIAVWSNDHNVDPVGACVGARGGRVRMVVNELRGEKIDIVPFSEDFPDFVAKALSPAKVTQVIVSDDGTQADVIVPDHQLSLAIGREGQNARLAARLTGVRIDIRCETQLAEGVPSRRDESSGVEYEEGEWVANAETGEMEWHAADGTVISETEWNAQAAGGGERRPTPRTPLPTRPPTAEPADGAGRRRRRGRRRRPTWRRRRRRRRARRPADGTRRRRHRRRRTTGRRVIDPDPSAHASGAVSGDRRRPSSAVCSRPTAVRSSTARVPVEAPGCASRRVTASSSPSAARRSSGPGAGLSAGKPSTSWASSSPTSGCDVMTRKVE